MIEVINNYLFRHFKRFWICDLQRPAHIGWSPINDSSYNRWKAGNINLNHTLSKQIFDPTFSTSWIIITYFRLSAKEPFPKSPALRSHRDTNLIHKWMFKIHRIKLICKINYCRQEIYPRNLRFAVLQNTIQFNNNRLIIKFITTILFRTKICTPNNNMEHRIINNIIQMIQITNLKVE